MKKSVAVLLLFFSLVKLNAQDITAAEYFFDADPGVGNGIPITISSPGSTVNLSLNIPVNTLTAGFHMLAIRVKGADGKWGLYERRSFYIPSVATDMPLITAAEYFYDNDPGIGNAIPLPLNAPGNIIMQNFAIPVPQSMTVGNHFLTIRVKDQAGNWSLFEKDTITVGTVQYSITCPANVTINPAAGQCSAIADNIDPVVTPAGSSYTYTLSGATTGNGNGTASGETFNAGVTTVTYALTNSPTTSCSFNVTVNSPAIPSVNIQVSTDSVCPAQQITFTATPNNGGTDPTYQWKKNGNNVGDGGNIYQSNVWSTGDVVTVVMTSSGCGILVSDTSNAITLTVIPPYITPTINIVASTTSICPGTNVTFTATSTNGGVPHYGWNVNGVYIPGDGSNFFESSTLANGDKITCTMTSSLACVTDVTTVSNMITMTVMPVLPAQVNISASSTTICSGQSATFTATPTNGGEAPFYEWRLNGNIVGDNGDTYETSTLQNGDNVQVTLVSSLVCASPQVVNSNSITMSVLPSTPVFVTINASATTICVGSSVTFNVTQVSPGAGYQWQLNGSDISGATGTTYESSSIQNGDKIKVMMTPSSPCATPSPAVSNEITMTVNSSATPSVSIDASATSICANQLVTFTATPVNAGSNIVYEWILNNNAVGSNSPIYQNASLANGDQIKVTMASSQVCGGYSQAVSNTITITVDATVTPSLTVSTSSGSICAGALVTFYASPISGAGSAPSFQWKRNGVNIPGATNATYQSSSLQNGDVIRVAMTSSLSCANPQTVLSHDSVTMIVSSVPLIPSVTISASATTICQGQTVLFTAVPTNGGDVPGYQWKLNGINVGDNVDTFSTNSLHQGDKLTVEMNTSVPCSTSPTATSAPVTMTVTTIATFYADFDGDGYGNGASGVAQACTAPTGYVSNNSDCNDNNVSVHPGTTEICGNGIDDDCDGQLDETCGSPDNDGDGYTVAQGDCNDSNASINPGATEICGNSLDDNCNGNIDENCTEDLPVLVLKTYPVKEGDAGYITLNAELKLDRPATATVNVNYATSNANATAGSDYVAANGILTIPPGAVSGIVQVRILGDFLQENNESFWINFSNPINVVIGKDPRGRIMIIDDDKGKGNDPTTRVNQDLAQEEMFRIPSVAKRNQVWMIPQIENYENEVLIVSIQGQVMSKLINYKNQTAIGNVAAGIYFYRIRLKGKTGQDKFFTGRLLITE